MTLTVAPSPTFPTIGGRDIAVFPGVSECTVAQAAQFLDGTEGLVHELVDAGLIGFRLDNGERLIDQNSLSDYVHDQERRHAAADELFSMFREIGLSDD